jgi:hypothetical protein
VSPAIDLGLPPESIQREKSVGMWYEASTLRVRGHLRDRYTDPDRAETVLHEYRLDLWVDRDTMIVHDARIEPIHLPYGECFRAPENIDRLIGLKLRPGFTADALARLQGEAGCTHMNSLISDLSIASLFHGYITLRAYEREHGTTPVMPPDDHRTGICAGWQAGGALAAWMESGRGIAPSHIYPTTMRRTDP